jgi:F0F1-type ATP synthase assembly protein I
MSPDPVVDEDEDVADSAVDLVEPTDVTLFGGASVDTDDSARRGIPGPEDIDLDEDADEDLEEETDEAPRSTMSALAHGAWIVGQSVIAVLFGAGLFIAFDQLWKWNVIVAMVLAVLVILGLVAGVRVVRKTEDIGTTLITIVVGALVTFGPLALQSV